MPTSKAPLKSVPKLTNVSEPAVPLNVSESPEIALPVES